MSGYMDLRRPRVYRRSNVGLVVYIMMVLVTYGMDTGVSVSVIQVNIMLPLY